MNLTKYDIAILLGLLLGNGHIDSKGQIHIKHSKKQKSIVNLKQNQYILYVEDLI